MELHDRVVAGLWGYKAICTKIRKFPTHFLRSNLSPRLYLLGLGQFIDNNIQLGNMLLVLPCTAYSTMGRGKLSHRKKILCVCICADIMIQKYANHV